MEKSNRYYNMFLISIILKVIFKYIFPALEPDLTVFIFIGARPVRLCC